MKKLHAIPALIISLFFSCTPQGEGPKQDCTDFAGTVSYISGFENGEGYISITEVSGSFENLNYEWSNGETGAELYGLSPGIYTATITGSLGCSVTKEIELREDDSGSNDNNVFIPGGGVTDIDGNSYSTIIVGSQEWMAENLRTTRYANGDTIPNLQEWYDWERERMMSGAWCYYDNDPSYNSLYGKLYNWYTTVDPRNVCPTGWHVPTELEWRELADYLGGKDVAGGKMKTIGYAYWKSPNTYATNISGFSGLPGGSRWGGSFGTLGIFGFWWSTTAYMQNNGWYVALDYREAGLTISNSGKSGGLSCRCIKD